MKKLYVALILTIVFWPGFLTVYSSEAGTEDIFIRPQVEYKATSLRDPFKEDILKKDEPEIENKSPDLAPPDILPAMNVQGLIWGGNFTQAIINNRVYRAGDVIDGAQIKDIAKDGVTLNFSGGEVKMPAPKRQQIE